MGDTALYQTYFYFELKFFSMNEFFWWMRHYLSILEHMDWNIHRMNAFIFHEIHYTYVIVMNSLYFSRTLHESGTTLARDVIFNMLRRSGKS